MTYYSIGGLGDCPGESKTRKQDSWEERTGISVCNSTTKAQKIGYCQTDIKAGNPNSWICDILGSNASTAEATKLCHQGNRNACYVANIEPLTQAELAQQEKNRNEQALQQQAAIAKKLRNVGQHQVADAVEKQAVVEYKKATLLNKIRYKYKWCVLGGLGILGAASAAYFIWR
jgi:hypothetical protein